MNQQTSLSSLNSILFLVLPWKTGLEKSSLSAWQDDLDIDTDFVETLKNTFFYNDAKMPKQMFMQIGLGFLEIFHLLGVELLQSWIGVRPYLGRFLVN